MFKGASGAILLAAMLFSWAVAADEPMVPVEHQVPIFLKILTFDRNLQARVGDEIVFLVVFQKQFRQSLLVKQAWERRTSDLPVKTVEGISFRSVYFDLTGNIDLATVIAEQKPDIIYVAPLRAYDASSIFQLSRRNKILTMSGVQEHIQGGAAVGLELRASAPRIMINLDAARAEGADFSSQLLKLAQMVKAEQ